MARKLDGVTGSREAYWRRQVGAWERSGESVRGYCRSRGLSESGFHFWKRELKRRDAGAASKVSVGITVFGGMIFATILTTLAVPAFYVLIQGLSERFGGDAPPAIPPATPATEATSA